MTNPNGDPFASGGERNPAFSWDGIEAPVTYRFHLTAWPTTVQARDYDDRTSPIYWDPVRKGKKTTVPNDQPVMNAVIEATLPDGSPTSLFATVRGESLYFAIAEAQQVAGQHLAPGGTLDVTLTARTPDPDNPQRKPRKEFTALYYPPAAFAEPAPAAQPAAAPVQPPAAAPVAPPAPPAAPAAPVAPPAAAAPTTKPLTAEQYAALSVAGIDMAPFHIEG